ncbi:MAG: SPOR domain-containing protein [Xanthomonadales bacterium]|nr:SPOR domain-containing protein [Xanthomonadales bacterium]
MARRTNHARRGASTALPAWLWLVAGIVIGVVLALLAVRSGLAPGLRPAQEQPQPQAARPGGSPEEAAPPARATTYDFYTVLPEMEVLIPDSELRAQVRAETPPAGTTPAGTAPAESGAAPVAAPAGTRYRLQAGSFRDPRPAEEAKARLALLGISASVQSVNVNGNTFHRVYVGPYASAAEVDRVKRQLADNGVQAITVREQTP